jgi:hypothetical protein
LTLADDPRVILIKIADRLHNMRTMDSMSRDKQLKISSETTFLYAPLAMRLGLYEIKSELEDLSMKYTENEVFEDITQKLKDTKRERTKYINEFIKPIKVELERNHFDFDIYEPTYECLKAILPHLSKGSIIAFDELNCPAFPGETVAVKKLLDLNKLEIKRSPLTGRESYIIM